MMKLWLICAWLLLVCFNSVRCEKVPTRIKSSDRSGLSRIVGGKPASAGQWPWQAAVFQTTSHSSKYRFICGGTLIGPKLVISAAHCFDRDDSDVFLVVLGVHDFRTFSLTRQLRYVTKFTNHPSYDWSTATADISLLELEIAVIYNDYVQPAILPNSSTNVKSDLSCVVSGYGNTNGTGDENVLNYAQVDIIPLDTCQSWYSSFALPVTDDHVCAGNASGGVDSCQGDSGGPLVCRQSHATSDGYFLLGVTSFGEGCARPQRPGVYTNVISYLDWIMEYNVISTTPAPTSQPGPGSSSPTTTTSTTVSPSTQPTTRSSSPTTTTSTTVSLSTQPTTRSSSPTTTTSTTVSPSTQPTTRSSSPTTTTSTTVSPSTQPTTRSSSPTTTTSTTVSTSSQPTTRSSSPTTTTSTTVSPSTQRTTRSLSPTTTTSTIAPPSSQQPTSGSEEPIPRSYFVILGLLLLQYLMHLLY